MKQIKPIVQDLSQGETTLAGTPIKLHPKDDAEWFRKMKPELEPNLIVADPSDRLMNYATTEHLYETVDFTQTDSVDGTKTSINNIRNPREHEFKLDMNDKDGSYVKWLDKYDNKVAGALKEGYQSAFRVPK